MLLHVDLETKSGANIKQTGVSRYVNDPDFSILLIAYAIDDGPVKMIDVANGESTKLFEKLLHRADHVAAFNAPFEIACLTAFFSDAPPLSKWICLQVLSLVAGIPGGLKQVGERLGLTDLKLDSGTRLITRFCIPPFEEPTGPYWDMFKAYGKQDVVAAQAVYNEVKRFRLSPAEQKLWELDQRMNAHGVYVDTPLVDQAISAAEMERARLLEDMRGITGLENPGSAQQLLAWLREYLPKQENLRKDSVVAALETPHLPDDVRTVLELRQQVSKSSIAKWRAYQRSTMSDGWMRDLLQFYGACRTGRWAGRRLQFQNLPQNHLDDLDELRALLRAGKFDDIRKRGHRMMDVLSQLIRTAVIAPPGKTLVAIDFSAIEAVVLAWLAGCEWRLDVFRGDGKIYERSAAAIFGVPVDSITKEHPLRQRGKVAELACIAQGQRVLTDRGLVPIQDVQLTDMLWDGIAWVKHDGVIFKGVKEVNTYDGLTATADHLVFTEQGLQKFKQSTTSGSRLIRSGSGGTALRVGEHYQRPEKAPRPWQRLHTGAVHELRRSVVEIFRQFKTGSVQRLSTLFTTPASTYMVGETGNGHAATVYQFKGSRVSELWGPGDTVQVYLGDGSSTLDTRKSWVASGFGNRPNQQQWSLRTRKFTLPFARRTAAQPAGLKDDKRTRNMGENYEPLFCSHYPPQITRWFQRARNCRAGFRSGKREIQMLANDSGQTRRARTYDILNAGPRNRFTVSDVLVHNCGYGGGVKALITMGALKYGIPEDELDGIKVAWRKASPEIPRFWYALERAAVGAILNPREVTQAGEWISFQRRGKRLYMKLPCGRELTYPNIGLKETEYGTSICYDGLNQYNNQWERISTWGGKLAENATQAVARDCLAEAKLRICNDVDLAVSVHDEPVYYAPADHDPQPIIDRITAPIEWAPGLPLKAHGGVLEFYQK